MWVRDVGTITAVNGDYAVKLRLHYSYVDACVDAVCTAQLPCFCVVSELVGTYGRDLHLTSNVPTVHMYRLSSRRVQR